MDEFIEAMSIDQTRNYTQAPAAHLRDLPVHLHDAAACFRRGYKQPGE
jgi:hypothetical protein